MWNPNISRTGWHLNFRSVWESFCSRTCGCAIKELITLHFNFLGRHNSESPAVKSTPHSSCSYQNCRSAITDLQEEIGQFSWRVCEPAEITQSEQLVMFLSWQSKNKTLEHKCTGLHSQIFQRIVNMPLLFVLWISTGCRQTIKSLRVKQKHV